MLLNSLLLFVIINLGCVFRWHFCCAPHVQLSVKCEAVWKGRKIAAFMAILCRAHVSFFCCSHIWHCMCDNTIMSDMIYSEMLLEIVNTGTGHRHQAMHMQNKMTQWQIILLRLKWMISSLTIRFVYLPQICRRMCTQSFFFTNACCAWYQMIIILLWFYLFEWAIFVFRLHFTSCKSVLFRITSNCR